MIDRNTPIAIHQLMNKFETGDMTLLEHISDGIDLAIEHYQDEADVEWQRCKNKQGFISLLGRLSEEIFPKGTKITNLNSRDLGDGWYSTQLSQTFWYGVVEETVEGKSIILSHEAEGVVDYFREVVQSVEPI